MGVSSPADIEMPDLHRCRAGRTGDQRMMDLPEHLVGLEPTVDVFVRDLLDRAAAIRLPELAHGTQPEALHRVDNRHGVTVVALRTRQLTSSQRHAILQYRLAQYLLADQLDPVFL